MIRFQFPRIGSAILGPLESGRSAVRIAVGISCFFVLISLASYLADVILLALFNTGEPGVIAQRVYRRIILEGFFGFRLVSMIGLCFALSFTLIWSLISRSGEADSLQKRLKPAVIILSLLVTSWILWSFIRVAIYYYMRLDIDFSLAVYTISELRTLIGSEIVATLQDIPVYIPLIFSVLLICLIAGVRAIKTQAGKYKSFNDTISEKSRGQRIAITYRPVILSLTAIIISALTLQFLPASQSGYRSVNQTERKEPLELDGPNPFPEPENIAPRIYKHRNKFRERFGFELPNDTNIVFIILESAREPFVDIENSKFFGAGPETLRVQNFFVPVPHSSNSHYSLFTGLHSERDFEEKYESMSASDSLPRLLEANGYKNYYIYTDHTAFESETVMLKKFGMHITEKKDLVKRKNPETEDLYASFQFGMDDIALLHATIKILDNEGLTSQPFSISVVMTNSHYPYLNPDPERFNRHNNNTILGRHRNGVDYGMHIADRIVEEFRKRGLDRKTLFVLMSDHGESFGERGFFRHSFSLYNEEVRVPLVFRHPKFSRLSSPADRSLPYGSMLDVFPTIFDMLGYDIQAPIHGRTLFDSDYEFQLPLWVWRLDDYRGLISGESKYIYNSIDNELYRLDLNDKLLEKWENPDGYALAFVESLMSLDFGKAGGVAASAGDRLGPIIDPDSPFAFGGSFTAGGGAFVFRCSDLPPYLNCLGESGEFDSLKKSHEPGVGTTPQKEEADRREKYPELLP
ncbi:MAG: sulfatase-like hydrolase/transferase [bacterium]|nr:sulfatase-like hydrolase/transferase [bacterium]